MTLGITFPPHFWHAQQSVDVKRRLLASPFACKMIRKYPIMAFLHRLCPTHNGKTMLDVTYLLHHWLAQNGWLKSNVGDTYFLLRLHIGHPMSVDC